jgi:NAD(P)-dependent dehydrogenase (short-subunit alcohol dehydrogenase family)
MLVTGAAGGLGSALSMVSALNGWQVVMLDKDKRGLERHYDAIVAAGGVEPCLQPMDLAAIGPEDCQQLFAALQNQFGGLDAVVHCAVSFNGLQPLDLVPPGEWLQQVQVNVNAPWLISINLLPLLRSRGKSSLIFMLDKQADSKPLWGCYGVCKSAVKGLAAQFRAELASTNVCVHAVDPGPMRTSLRSAVFHSENPSKVIFAEEKAKKLLSILEIAAKQQDFHICLDE